jgi:hypothetical protein
LKVICIHPRFAGLTSHHFNESYGLAQEFQRRGTEFRLLMSVYASAELAASLNGQAVLDDPTFRLEWSFEERSDRFLGMLHAQVDADLNTDDCIMITVSTQLEAHALTRWLQELPRNRKPWIVIVIVSDRWNKSGRQEYERQIAEFRVLKATLSALDPEDARRLIFFTMTQLLAEELGGLLGTKVNVAPMPLPYSEPGMSGLPRTSHNLPRVTILGGTRREKGSYLVPDIVRACRSHVQVEFVVHVANDWLTPEEVHKLAQVAAEPQVMVIDQPMSLAAYNATLNSTDIGLFPYEVIPYRQRTSGVFGETVANGKPVVATRGTWMAEQIEAGRAAGTIFDILEPNCIAQAVARCVADLASLQRSAKLLGPEWRRTEGIPAFVDLLEKHVPLRAS